FLRLNGVNAKDHSVFRELTRVKQYFVKIKSAEFGEVKRENLSLNKPATGRMIKHALAGNEKYDLQRAEQQAKEKARSHIRFEQISNKRKADEDLGLAVDAEAFSSSSSASESENESSEPVEVESVARESAQVDHPAKKKRRRMEKRQREAVKAGVDETSDAESKGPATADTTRKARKKRKKRKPLENAAAGAAEETILPSKPSHPPLGHSAAFQALLNGPLPKQDKRAPRPAKHERKRAKELAADKAKAPSRVEGSTER
ncbi:MAG: hypothetical protein M1830_003935, partial [Pleopsidium flavum]